MLRDEFRAMPSDTRVAQGDRTVLECSPPRGNPNPQVTWLKDGRYLEDSTSLSRLSSRMEITHSGNLVLKSVAKEDEGDYVCRATNMVGTRDSESARLSVHGKTPFHGFRPKKVFFLLSVVIYCLCNCIIVIKKGQFIHFLRFS